MRRYRKNLIISLVGLCFGLSFSTGLAANDTALSLGDLVSMAIREDRVIQGILLDQRISGLRDDASELPTYAAIAVQGSLSAAHQVPANASAYNVISGGPELVFRWGESGNTSLQTAADIRLYLDDQLSNNNSIAPSLQLSHRITDVLGGQRITTDEIRKLQQELRQEKELKDRAASITAQIFSILSSVLDQQRVELNAQQSLADAQLSREQLVTVQRRDPESLQVLQADDRIIAARIDIENARSQQNIQLESLRRLTRNPEILLSDLQNIPIPLPTEIAMPALPELTSFVSYHQSMLSLELVRLQDAATFQGPVRNLNLSASAASTYLPNQGSLDSFRIAARGTLNEGTSWSLGLELSYSSNERLSGPVLGLNGSWSPDAGSWQSEQNRIEREISRINLEQAEIQYQNTREDIQNTIRDYDTQIRQQQLSAESWNRRLAISKATLAEAIRSFEAGLTTQTAVVQAQLNLDSLLLQGRTQSLSMLSLIENIKRNTI
ncbi:TolC family protein [Spirochaeta dissipatitropha]